MKKCSIMELHLKLTFNFEAAFQNFVASYIYLAVQKTTTLKLVNHLQKTFKKFQKVKAFCEEKKA